MMTCSTYTKRERILHVAYIVFLTVAGVMAAISVVYSILHISCREDVLTLCFTVFLSVVILAVDFFECRAMGAQRYMDDEGIGVRRFGRTKVFLKWNEIKEIGTGSIPTPFGSKDRIYFCNRKLEEDEKTDLVVLKYHTVHFPYIPREWYQEMSRHLPVDMPDELREKYVR